MQRYKVRVFAKSYTDVEIDAESNTEAIRLAENRADHGYNRWSDRPMIMTGAGQVVAVGNVGEPLIKIPETWEIYSFDENEKPAKIANAKITAAVRMACADIVARHKKNEDTGPAFCTKLFAKYVAPVFKKYEKLGTYDSEPKGNVAHIIAKHAQWAGADYDEVYDAVRWR